MAYRPSLLEYLRGPLLFLTMSIVSTFAFLLNLVLFPLFKAWDPMLRHGHHVLACIVQQMMMLFFRVDVEGWEHLDQTKTPRAVMVANHQSAIDSLIFGYLWRLNFKATFKQEIMYMPCVGLCMWIAGYLPVKRGDKASGKWFLERCAELLRNNVWVLIFPEGTRKIDGSTGPLGPFKAGPFKLALDEDAALVPITISGARHIMPVRGFPYLAFGRVKLIIHAPVPSKGKTIEALQEECRVVIASRLEACDALEPLPAKKSKAA